MNIKNSTLIILIVVFAALFLVLQKYSKDNRSSEEQASARVAELATTRYLAANFTLADLNGDITQLSDYRDSVVLMLFWTTW